MASRVRILSRVKRLVAEYQVYQELLKMNHRGVTPKKREMVSWLNRFWHRSGDATDALLDRLAAREKSVTKWMRRFRMFWHISFGKLPLRNELTPEMEGIKVCFFCTPLFPKTVPTRGPFFGPGDWPFPDEILQGWNKN